MIINEPDRSIRMRTEAFRLRSASVTDSKEVD